jgi:hypothetical protein
MWKLWGRAKATGHRPSQLVDIDDSLAAYLFDGAVVTLGNIVENSLLETDESGSGDTKKRVNRYTLDQLLDPKFHLPRGNAAPVVDNSKLTGTSDGGIQVDTI